MSLQAGTTNFSSVDVQDNLSVGGAVSYSGTVTNTGGQINPGTLYTAAGTVTFASGLVVFNVSAAGFAVRLPAPTKGASFQIVNQIAPSAGTNSITIPAGGTIYQGTVSGTVLNFTTVGQTAWLVGLSSTQYRSMQPGTMNPTVS